MKKIGIITYSGFKSGTYNCNYGTALQGYALVRQLRDLGYEVYDINYLSDYEYHAQQYNLLKRILIRIWICIGLLLLNPNPVRAILDRIKDRDNSRKIFDVFKQFVTENNLTYMNGKYYTLDALNKESEAFYAFITGSDTVWDPYMHMDINDPGYFLDFAANGVKRISYAASFGVTVLSDESRKTLKSYLEKFDAVSVREKSGAELIKKETGLDVQVVLDPTLLIEPQKYDGIVKKPEKLPDKYIAVYKFGDIPHTEEKIRELSEKLNLPIVYIPSGKTSEYNVRYDMGPGEFIYVIRNAELAVSDSFHCTVFCLINHTPFLTFYRTVPMQGKEKNSRMTDLLDMVGLSNRIVKPGESIDYDELFNIDFEAADKKIEEMRKESLTYLKNALED